MGPVFWLVGLAVLFLIYDEAQRLRRRVKALEERLERLDGGGNSSGNPPAGSGGGLVS